MKRIASFLLLTAITFGLTASSCTQTPAPEPEPAPQPEPEPEPEPEPSGPQPGIYKFVASPLKGTWEAGDQIYVHGNLGTNIQTVVLTATDISQDGKTATATLDAVTESYYEPDGLYAAWPAQAVYMYKGVLKTKTTFENCEGLLTQSYLTDDTFTFIDVSSPIRFTVDGDYDSWAMCSNERNPVCITRFECEYSSLNKAFNYKQNDGYPYRYGSIVSGAGEIWLPGDFAFPNGFTLFFGKGGSWTAAYKETAERKLTAGEVLNLGKITPEAYEGLPPTMPRQGEGTKYKVEFNELSGICLSEDGTFIWGAGDNGDLARISFEGEVLSEVHIGGDAEDISINPVTHDLLIGLEPDGVGVVKAPDYNTRVSTLFSIPACKNYGNAGIEGLTYYKDGMIFVGSQSNSHLFLCDLDSKAVLWEAKLYDKNRVSEIAGLSYDPLTGWLWIVDSESKKVYVYAVDHTIDGEGKYSVQMDYLGAYPIVGTNPESVCVDQIHHCVWIGDDADYPSYLYRYEFSGLEDYIL